MTGQVPPVWHTIVPDKYKCRCDKCGKHSKTDEVVLVDRKNGLSPILMHFKCLPAWWLEKHRQGEPVKRGVARIWHARGWPPKLKQVKKSKIDYSIPKELKRPKRH